MDRNNDNMPKHIMDFFGNNSKKVECSGCGACYQICPKDCISMETDSEGFLYPKVDESKCINCGMCYKTCPMINDIKRDKQEILVYACKNKKDNQRLESSSGGVFSLLAQKVIENNGVVFGAAFDEDMNVIHRYAESLDSIEAFRGSKYVQSNTLNTFKQVKQFLDNKKQVLFSGTPCQVNGLTKFLGNPYDNLILINCVCMGVPSPQVYKKYIDYINSKYTSKLQNVNFRCKNSGWKNYSLKLSFEDGQVYCSPHNQDLYLKGFSKILFLRPSCHDCRFKDFRNVADITLGDYWGVHTKFPDFDDDKGVSLILVNNQKGQTLFESIRSELIVRQSDIEHAIKTHYSLVNSIQPNKKRSEFLQKTNCEPIDLLLKKYTKITPYEFAKKGTKYMLKKLGLFKTQ